MIEIDGDRHPGRRAAACATTPGACATGRRSRTGAGSGSSSTPRTSSCSTTSAPPDGGETCGRPGDARRRRGRVRDCETTSELDPELGCQRRFVARATDELGREHVLEGEAVSVAPLRQRRDGRLTTVNEGRTRLRWGGHEGLGISEYLFQSSSDARAAHVAAERARAGGGGARRDAHEPHPPALEPVEEPPPAARVAHPQALSERARSPRKSLPPASRPARRRRGACAAWSRSARRGRGCRTPRRPACRRPSSPSAAAWRRPLAHQRQVRVRLTGWPARSQHLLRASPSRRRRANPRAVRKRWRQRSQRTSVDAVGALPHLQVGLGAAAHVARRSGRRPASAGPRSSRGRGRSGRPRRC